MLLLFMHFSCLEMCVHTDMITQQTFWCLSHVWLMLYITNRIGLNRKLTNRNLTSASLGVRFILSSIWGNRGAEMKVFLRSFFKQMIKRRQIDVEATEGKCKDWDLNSQVPAETCATTAPLNWRAPYVSGWSVSCVHSWSERDFVSTYILLWFYLPKTDN